MKLIIDIQDFVYNHIKEFNSTQLYELNVITAIKNGIPLSEELKKIRAEIDTARFIDKDTKLCKNANASGLEVTMQIIDEYKAESEPKEENKKECSTCKSDNSLENCLGCIEYGHWELKEDNKQSKCNSCQNNTDELSGECYECVKGIEDWYEPIFELKGENK